MLPPSLESTAAQERSDKSFQHRMQLLSKYTYGQKLGQIHFINKQQRTFLTTKVDSWTSFTSVKNSPLLLVKRGPPVQRPF
jgi:hypothetical protein